MPRIVSVAVALLLILATGFVHGTWTGRWSVSRELEEAAARLDQAPGDIGDWKATPDSIDAETLALAGAVGSWVRTYRHAGSKEVLTVILLCGRAGPMSVHRPEHCYRGAGYDVVSPTTQTSLETLFGPAGGPGGAAPAEFRTAVFSKPGPDGPSSLRILWSWYTGRAWQAPDSPRLTFARLPALYKLYVIRPLDRPPERLEEDPAVDFLRQLLPELDKALSLP
jgi:hypothetical protein